MKVQVLGCSGSIAAGARTSAFLVDEDLLIDAGTGVGDLALEAMARIDHIFLSHSHLDHVLAVGLLADSVIRLRMGRPPIVVHALPETLAALRTHVFNNVIWPDFSRLPTPEQPVLRLEPLACGDVITVGERRVEALPAAHSVPAVGYAVRPSGDPAAASWVYTGDTGPNPALWQRLAQLPVAALVIEVAFRNDEHALAQVSRHLCPRMLGAELAQLTTPTEVCITHIKPGETTTVMQEVAALVVPHRIRALAAGDVMSVD